jgi:hypothetical protein
MGKAAQNIESKITSTLKERFGEGKKGNQPEAEHDDKKALAE